MRTETRSLVVVVLLLGLLGGVGCQNKVEPDYNRALPPGHWALRKLQSEGDWPDLRQPYRLRSSELAEALAHSERWYAAPSSKQFFPMHEVTHERARLSVTAMRQLLAEAPTPEAFEEAVRRDFDCYTSVGYDDAGTVLYTGYYTGVFPASRVRTSEYTFPIYKRPADLESEPGTGRVLGQRTGSGLIAYPTRSQIESSGMLAGSELVWVRSRFDQYVIQVNGSARLQMTDGRAMYIGFAGTNGREYTGLGTMLIRDGVFEPERLNLPAMRDYFATRPDDFERYLAMNDRYVFFTEYDGANWPAGSLGVRVTTQRTLATDKTVFPRGSFVLVQTRIPTASGGEAPFDQFMVDQDTGGAIRAAGRGDIYMGIGRSAEMLAGRQFSEGRLYYFFLKEQRLPLWQDRSGADVAGASF